MPVWEQSAERLLTKFIEDEGGTVPTSALEALYRVEPWLVKAVGSLERFCQKCLRLVYVPRAAHRKATVSTKVLPALSCLRGQGRFKHRGCLPAAVDVPRDLEAAGASAVAAMADGLQTPPPFREKGSGPIMAGWLHRHLLARIV